MANLALVLKEEIRRLARKEVKAQVGSTRQSIAQYRREIAALKRRLAEQAKKIARLEAGHGKRQPAVGSTTALPESVRFSSRSVKAQRRRSGLSAELYGQLVGVSGLTIHNWENGKARPRKAQLAALIAVRGLGKREAMSRVEQLSA